MNIYIDFENTLLASNNIVLPNDINYLKSLSKKHNIFILSNSSINQIESILDFKDIHIISTLENAHLYNKKLFADNLDNNLINKILDINVYTAYSFYNNQCEIYNYKNRLKNMYPLRFLKIVDSFNNPISFLIIVIANDQSEIIYNILSDYSIEILGKDNKRTIFKITKTIATKEAWLLKTKKSPTIGIGDSLSDYEFIKHCDYKVAMKNSADDLKTKCDYITEFDNNNSGVTHFLNNFIKHHSS